MEILATIMPYIIAVLAAATSYLVARINNKKAIERIATLEEFMASDDMTYYVICPNCGAKLCLNKLRILSERIDPTTAIPAVEGGAQQTPKEDK